MTRAARPSPARAFLAAAGLAAAAGCAPPAPRAIAWGEEPCRHCHMTVADPRFAAELVTRKGVVYAFDDVGCLAAFVRAGKVPSTAIHSVWVYDFLRPDTLLDARTALYLSVDSLRTPMGGHLLALRPGAAADSLRARLGGQVFDWETLPVRGHEGSRDG